MKLKYIYFIIAAFIIIVAAPSCKKDLAKANINPDQITSDKYDPNLLLTTVQLGYPGSTNFGGSAWATKWGAAGCFIQHVASTNAGFYYGDKYLNNISAMGEMFQDAYTSSVQPVVELYQLTANKPQYRNLHQMARIMKAMVFEQITDQYGDIPYFQAGLGYYDRIYTPVYDTQKAIYTDLLKEVSQATDSLDESADKPSGDILYAEASDQIAEWKMFGNSLLLRMAMRLTNVDPATAQTYVKKAAANTMGSNDDNAIINREITGNAITENQDGVQILGNDSTDIRLSSAIVSNMKTNNDPRLPVIAWLYQRDDNGNPVTDNDPDDQLGLPSGYIIGGANATYDLSKQNGYPTGNAEGQYVGLYGYSRLSDNILSTTAPNLILTYAETEFLLADASVRWGASIAGDAATHYNNGVVAAVLQLDAYGVSMDEGDAQTYLDGQKFSTVKNTQLNQINTQYWLCTLMDEYEAWSNWRRTEYPVLVPTHYPGNVTNGTIPRRLTYPQTQKTTNLANYNAAVARLTGGDKITSRVWWDTLP